MNRAEFLKLRNQLIGNIVVLALEITSTGKHCVFFDYCGHVNYMYLHYYHGGYPAGNKIDISPICDSIDSDIDELYTAIITKLRKYLDVLLRLKHD